MIFEQDETLKDIKTRTIIAFLQSKGWEIMKKTRSSFYVIPPKPMRATETTHLSIPLPEYEQAEDFPFVIGLVINSISILYEIDKQELVKLFSQSLEELKAEMALKQEILAFA